MRECTRTRIGDHMWQGELANRFEKMGENGDAGAVRVRVGTRPHLHTVAIVVWDSDYENRSDSFHAVEVENIEEAAERTSEILEDAGFASEFANCRVDFLHAISGKPLRGWNATEDLINVHQVEGPMVEQVLAESLRLHTMEIRRMFGMICETLQVREERIDSDRDEIMDLTRAEVLSRAEAEMTQILAEEAVGAEVEVDPLKAHAGEILGAIAQKFLANSENPRDTILGILRNDPQLTSALATDPEVMKVFTDSMEQASQEEDLQRELGHDPLRFNPCGHPVESFSEIAGCEDCSKDLDLQDFPAAGPNLEDEAALLGKTVEELQKDLGLTER
jgi:hypothetical protein